MNIRPSVIETNDSRPTSPYALAVGSSAQGNISNTNDFDYFTIAVIAGQKYSIALVGTGQRPMVDPYLRILDTGGSVVASNDDVADSRLWSEVEFTARSTGNITLEIGSAGSDPGGQYGLSVSSGDQNNFDYFMGAGSLYSGNVWGTGQGQGTTVTFGFRATAASYSVPESNIASFSQLTTAQKDAVNLALNLWSEICGIKFQAVNPSGYTNNATILFGNYLDINDGKGAFAYTPESTSFSSRGGDVWLNLDSVKTSAAVLEQGTYSFMTIMHEIGHALGLTHPGPYNAGPGQVLTYSNNAKFVQDSGQYTMMSYFDGSETGQSPGLIDSSDTPLVFDILAMQNLYGANMQTRSGDTIYGFGANAGPTYNFVINSTPQFSIWDGGGIDTLDASGFSQQQVINLNQGMFSNIGGQTANISIALNVTIENTFGGIGNDSIVGNSVRNKIKGNGGNDSIDGGLGTDTAIYNWTAASYTISLSAGSSSITDLTASRDGADTLVNIERLKFSDISLALDVGPTENAGSVYMLYKAAFNRPSDVGGMGFWIAQKDGGANIVTSIAQGFVSSAEFIAKYGSNPSNASYVNNLYQNVLGRAGEAGGVAYWTGEMDAGRVSKAEALVQFATLPEGAGLVAPLIANGIQYQEWLG